MNDARCRRNINRCIILEIVNASSGGGDINISAGADGTDFDISVGFNLDSSVASRNGIEVKITGAQNIDIAHGCRGRDQSTYLCAIEGDRAVSSDRSVNCNLKGSGVKLIDIIELNRHGILNRVRSHEIVALSQFDAVCGIAG